MLKRECATFFTGLSLFFTSHLSIANADLSEKKTFKYPNGATHAISITFDDGWQSQVDKGIPILNKHGVKGTFYVMPEHMRHRLPAWKKAAEQGHELGSHTTSHLCTGNFAWLREHNAGLEQVTLDWLKKDIEAANQYIHKHTGVTPKSFAYPCGNTFVGRGKQVRSYVPLIAGMFESGRTWLDETANNPHYADFAQLTGLRMDGTSFKDMKRYLDLVKEQNKWIILAGHHVGQQGLMTVDENALDQLLAYINDPGNGFYVDTVENITQYIKKHRPDPITQFANITEQRKLN